ncbi:hypothetical protein [Halomonas sp. SpR8]
MKSDAAIGLMFTGALRSALLLTLVVSLETVGIILVVAIAIESDF